MHSDMILLTQQMKDSLGDMGQGLNGIPLVLWLDEKDRELPT